ncbi:hypothetical protein GOV09_06240 [Candidatus Woesearchaeota archaeon]|nr:hypothetical protein [Candidatus Woesearchaeota archaeon]
MAIGKKSAFFTIVSIILVAGLLFFYVSSNRYSEKERSRVITIRVATMNSFINDIEHDIERGLFISSMRSLIGMTEYVAENGTFYTDFEASFNEAIFNGTADGMPLNLTFNSHFGTWMEKVTDIGSKLDLRITTAGMKVVPFHDDPWRLKVTVIGTINITDRKGLASWKRVLNVTTALDIQDFEDPLYTIISSGKLTNQVIATGVTDFVDGSDASNLITHANNSLYIASSSAPSFLMRFEGNLSPSPYGIESIVDIPTLQVVAPTLYDGSSSTIDYIFFGVQDAGCQVNQTKTELPWLRLDNPHLPTYESTCS